MTHHPTSDHDHGEPRIRHFPEGTADQTDPERSMQQASPSLRNLAASAYTFEGQQERGFNAAELASRGGWRGRAIKIMALATLVLVLLLMLSSAFSR